MPSISMMYVGVLLLSLLSCWIGFALEITRGNVAHVQNDRPPNAGVALFPNIPLVPISYLVIVWLLNLVHVNVGFLVVTLYAGISIVTQFVMYFRARMDLQRLTA